MNGLRKRTSASKEGRIDTEKKKVFLTAQSVLCVIIAVMLMAAALEVYHEGLVLRAGDPLSWIYTREKAAAALLPVLPLFVLSLALTAAGLGMGIRDEIGENSVKDTECLRDPSVPRVSAPGAAMLRMALLGFAFFLIVTGILNGSAGDVFRRAVGICTECVGFG